MRRLDLAFAYCSLCLVSAIWSSTPAAGLTPSSVTLVSSANPSQLGQAVTLTATVSPSSATGLVTFYDGTTMLGTQPLISGQAELTTGLLASGARLLKAYYGGDAADEA